MSLDICPKCGGTDLITDRRRIREKMHPKLDLMLIPTMDEIDALCPDCDIFIKLFMMPIPSKERVIEMARGIIANDDEEFYLEK